MYRCVCHTCEETAEREALERAQAFVNDHADRGHAVEFVALESADRPLALEADDADG